jgi:hypothetical protein
MQLVRFIDQGLGGWQRREGNGVGFNQPQALAAAPVSGPKRNLASRSRSGS